MGDARDTVAAIKNVAQGKEGAGVGLVAAGIGWIPGVGDAGKALLKGGKKIVAEFAEAVMKRTLKAVPEDVVVNALKSFETRRMQFGEHTFQLDQPGMKHILQRHHPEFWDGSIKKTQSFLDPKMSIEEVGDAVHEVMKQNRQTLIDKGTAKVYQVTGTYKGQEYTLGLNNGRIAQFYPEPR